MCPVSDERKDEMMRTGSTVTIDNELGHVLRLTRWDDDRLSVEIAYDGNPADEGGNVLRFEAQFGIAGFLEDLAELFEVGEST